MTRSRVSSQYQPSSPFVFLLLCDYQSGVWLSISLCVPRRGGHVPFDPQLPVYLTDRTCRPQVGCPRKQKLGQRFMSFVCEVVPGSKGVGTRDSHTGYSYEQVTAVGNWGSVPLGNSGTSVEYAPQKARKWVSIHHLHQSLGEGCCWGRNVWARPACPAWPQWALLARKRALSREIQALAFGSYRVNEQWGAAYI